MARVNVPVISITRAGVDDAAPVPGDTTDQHAVDNSGDMWIEVDNVGVSSHTLSALFPHTVDGVTVDPKTWTIPAGERRRIGPFPIRFYGSTLQLDVDSSELELSAYRVAAQA